MRRNDVVRTQLLELLRDGSAHMSFDEAVGNFPMQQFNTFPPNVPYTPWHLLEHVRLTQRDILDFLTAPDYREGGWPDDYWLPQDTRADEEEWERTLTGFREDLATIERMVSDPGTDLYSHVPNGNGQTFLREFLLVADHNAYHIGEFAILRQVMDTWPPKRESS